MKKLLQLLNEYDKNWIRTEDIVYSRHYKVISKKFGFIQWLIVNNKIDKDRADNILYETEMFNRDPHTDFTDRLLMYLAISDDSINFLISILK